MRTTQTTTNSNLYNEDFYLWIKTTAKQLKDGNFAEIDLANLIEEIEEDLTESPSLKKYFFEVFNECYQDARKQASLETGLSLDTFPVNSPITPDESLNQDFLLNIDFF
jgi:hypothetical protein